MKCIFKRGGLTQWNPEMSSVTNHQDILGNLDILEWLQSLKFPTLIKFIIFDHIITKVGNTKMSVNSDLQWMHTNKKG